MADHPLLETVKEANTVIDKGGTTFQKFTCSHCGSRQTMDVPDTFYEEGTCEACGGLTEIKECGMMVIFSNNPGVVKSLLEKPN